MNDGPGKVTQDQASVLVHNQTNLRLQLKGNASKTEFGPLEHRLLADSVATDFKSDLDRLESRGFVRIGPPDRMLDTRTTTTRERIVRTLTILAFFLLLSVVVSRSVGVWLALAGGVLMFGLLFGFPEETRQVVGPFTVVALAFAIPGYFVTLGSDYVDLTYEFNQDFIYIILRNFQMIFIGTVSLLPGLLFFIFERRRSRSLRQQFARNIFRLDPDVVTLSELEAKYGSEGEEAYGSRIKEAFEVAEYSRPSGLNVGGLVAVIIATVLMAGGWTLALSNLDVTTLDVDDGAAATLNQLFTPSNTVITYAFLGAYFFALLSVLRGYLRLDLGPKTYGRIAVRLVEALIIGWVLQLVVFDVGTGELEVGEKALLAGAFLAGALPDMFWRWVQERQRALWLWDKGGQNQLWEKQPLTEIQGIDLYDRARLADEGMNNVEALAHGDLVRLMLHTRIPAERLIDWLDQAILIVKVGGAAEDPGDDQQAGETSTLVLLRSWGIRTATDLITVIEQGSLDELGQNADWDERMVRRLRLTEVTLRDDEWMGAIENWRTYTSNAVEASLV